MAWEAWYTLAVVAVCVGLLVYSRYAPDIILMAGLTLLLLAGVLMLATWWQVRTGLSPLDRIRRGEATDEGREHQLSIVFGDAVTLVFRARKARGRIGDGRDVGSIRVRDGQGRDVPHDVMFAFAYHAFWPEGIWMLGN